jgi:uncharacterized protein (DUF433 family)
MEIATEHLYIVRKKSNGEPVIKGTHVTVRGIVEWWRMGAQPEEIIQKISHITLAQVFDALSYYQDHQEEIDHFIQLNDVPEALSGTRLSR